MWGSKLTEESCLNRVGSVRRGRRPVVALALCAGDRAPGGRGALGDVAFLNRGPSGSPGGKLIFQIAANQGLMTAWGKSTVSVQPPFHDCTGEGSGLAGELTCEFDDFPAGKRVSLFVIVAARVVKNFPAGGTTDLLLTWTISPGGGSDTNQANNSTSHKIVVCGIASKDSRCKNAK